MELAHSTILALHHGVDETLRRTNRYNYYWPKIYEEVQLFVDVCIVCGQTKQPPAYLKAPHEHVKSGDSGWELGKVVNDH